MRINAVVNNERYVFFMKSTLYFSDFKEIYIFRHIFILPHTQLYGNLSSDRRADVCEQTDGHEGNWLLFPPWQCT
jgi:hypothetical protein